MRLTQLLFFKQKWPGNIYTGKKRCVKKVTFKDMVKLRDEYDRQVKVMTLLKHPYLTKVNPLIIIIWQMNIWSITNILNLFLGGIIRSCC